MLNWRPYLVPGLVFQSVIVGGGYATGRELVEFFMDLGPVGGLLGLVAAGCVFALVTGMGYEFARVTGAHDYRTFSRALLGPGWILFEIAYIAMVVLVLAVLGSAAGALASSALDIPAAAGTIGMMWLVGLLTFFGSTTIASVLAFWSVLLYVVYLLLFTLTFANAGDAIMSNLSNAGELGNWPLAGLHYAGYQVNIAAVLFCMTLLKTRRQAVGAGIMTGVIAIAPALLFYLAMLSQYPQIADQPVPALYLIAQLHSPWLETLFHIVVFGTFVETGAGLLHSINERIDIQVKEGGHALPRWARPGIAGALLLASIYGATYIGIVDLIARGYGFFSWVFILLFAVPLLTLGFWRILCQR